MVFNDFLILVLCVLSLCQRAAYRFYIAILFSFSFGLHSIFSGCMSDFNYYFSDGIIGLMVLVSVALFSRPTRFSDLMIVSCGAIIFSDFLGWFYLYEGGFSPMAYNLFFSAIHSLVLYALLKGDKKDEPLYLSRLRFIRMSGWQGVNICNPLHKKAKTI